MCRPDVGGVASSGAGFPAVKRHLGSGMIAPGVALALPGGRGVRRNICFLLLHYDKVRTGPRWFDTAHAGPEGGYRAPIAVSTRLDRDRVEPH